MEQKFEPEVMLSRTEQGELLAIASMPGYKVMHRIFRAEVQKFIVNLMNADESNPKEVLARHLLSKAAAQVYEGLTKRLNREIEQYAATIDRHIKPVDTTEGTLDLGEFATGDDDGINNLLEEAG